MKRTLKIVLILICLLVTFRAQLFRFCVAYVPLEQVYLPEKPNVFSVVDQRVTPALQSSLKQQIHQALQYTADHLYFTTSASSKDPIQLLQKPAANCIGYGTFFQHRLSYQLKQTETKHKYELQQWRGKLYLFGWDIHSWFKSPFWKDHDFNIIIDHTNGKKIAVDATLYDYFYIRSVRLHPSL